MFRQSLKVSNIKYTATTKPNKQVLFTGKRPGRPLCSLCPTAQTYSFQKQYQLIDFTILHAIYYPTIYNH